VIKGIENANAIEGVVVFHAGTKNNDENAICAAGGRVLNITAQAKTLEKAVSQAYKAIDAFQAKPPNQSRPSLFTTAKSWVLKRAILMTMKRLSLMGRTCSFTLGTCDDGAR